MRRMHAASVQAEDGQCKLLEYGAVVGSVWCCCSECAILQVEDGQCKSNLEKRCEPPCAHARTFSSRMLIISHNTPTYINDFDVRVDNRPNGHGEILAYNTEVQNSGIKGFMCTAATSGNVHEVNLRDKTIVASMVDQLDQGALNLKELGCKHLPFNVLERW